MKKDRRGRAVSRPPMSPIVTKHVIIQHDGRREHIIVEQVNHIFKKIIRSFLKVCDSGLETFCEYVFICIVS